MVRRALLLAIVVLLVASCDGEGTVPDAGVDAGTDGGRVDAHVDAATDSGSDDAGPDCGAVAGTYSVTWIGRAANAPGCTPPLDTIEIADDGLDVLSPGETCSGTGCSIGTCVRMALDASCRASLAVSGPCAGLVAGRTITTTFGYGGVTAAFTSEDTMSAAGHCAFDGTASRR